MTNNDRLRTLIKKYALTQEQVATLVRVKNKSAVKAWVYDQNPMPDGYLELLTLKIEALKNEI